MSSRSYRSAGRGTRGLPVTNYSRSGQSRQGAANAIVREEKMTLSATFLKAPRMQISKSMTDALNAMKAVIRIDFNAQGAGVAVIIPNSAIPGSEKLEMPTIEDLAKVGGMAQFVQTAKKEDASVDVRRQAMTDSFKVVSSLKDEGEYARNIPIDNNGLAMIKQWTDALKVLEENRKTFSKNQSPETRKDVRETLIRDCTKIRNAIFYHLQAIVKADTKKDSTPRSESKKIGVSEFMYSLLTKKVSLASNLPLQNILFPKNDILKGFYLTVEELRSNLPETYYSNLLSESEMLVAAFRHNKLFSSICFVDESDIDSSSEVMNKLKNQQIVMVPPYKLAEIAQRIADRKIGMYESKWVSQVNLLESSKGPRALNHMFLKLILCQPRSGDLCQFYEAFFGNSIQLLDRIKNKSFSDSDNIGHWLLKEFDEEDSIPQTYSRMYQEWEDEEHIANLYAHFLGDLGFLRSSNVGKALASFLKLNLEDEAMVFKRETVTTKRVTGQDDKGHDLTESTEEVRVKSPNFYLRVPIVLDEDIISKGEVEHDLSLNYGLGKETNASGDSPEGTWKRIVFREVFDNAEKTSKQLRNAPALTTLTSESKSLLTRLAKKNAGLALSISNYLSAFSCKTAQNFAAAMLLARFDQLVTDEAFSLPDDSKDDSNDGEIGSSLDFSEETL